MDIKIAKFIPLALGGVFAVKELLTLVFTYQFNLEYYLFVDGFYVDPILIIYLVMLLLKLAFALGALYQFKLYSDSKVSQVKVVAGILVGVYFLRSAMSALFEGRPQGAIVTLLSGITFILLIANLVVALTVKSSGTPQQPRKQAQYQPPVQMAQPVQYLQQPAQNFGAHQGQSIPDQLAALQALVDAGTLSEAEFKATKQRIIGG